MNHTVKSASVIIVESLRQQGVKITDDMIYAIETNVEEFGPEADSHRLIPVQVGASLQPYSTKARIWLHSDGEWATFPEGDQ